MTALSSVSQSDLFTVVVVADGALQESSAENISNWAVATDDGSGASCAIVSATLSPNTTVTLKVHPELSPNGSYTITSDNVLDASATALTTEELSLTVGTSTLPSQNLTKPFQGLLEGLFSAIGEELDDLNGVPATRLVNPANFGDARIYVESTLGFSTAASFYLDGMLVKYSSKTDGSFEGLTWPTSDEEGYRPLAVINDNVKVTQDVKSVP